MPGAEAGEVELLARGNTVHGERCAVLVPIVERSAFGRPPSHDGVRLNDCRCHCRQTRQTNREGADRVNQSDISTIVSANDICDLLEAKLRHRTSA